jgi:hypothetical protein
MFVNCKQASKQASMSEGGGGDSMMMMMMMMMFMGCASSSLVLSGGLGWMAYEDKFCEWWDMFCEEETGGGEGGGGGGDETETDPPSSTTSTSTTRYKSVIDQHVGGKSLDSTRCATSLNECKAKCTANPNCAGFDFGPKDCPPQENPTYQCFLRGQVASRVKMDTSRYKSHWKTYCKGSCPKTDLTNSGYTSCRGKKVDDAQQGRVGGSAVYVKTAYECAKKCTGNCQMFEVGRVGNDHRARCLLFSTKYSTCADNMLKDYNSTTVYRKKG